MSERIENAPPLIALRLKHKDAYDAMAMLFYLLLVYVWGLWIYPLGRDYVLLGNGGEGLPALSRAVWRWEVQFWGAGVLGYHLVNLALMYLCMLLLYRFINTTARGLWWFGTLGACLFMANPVHSESMHNLSGAIDLLPCLLGIAALTTYANLTAAPGVRTWVLAILAVSVAPLAYVEHTALGIVILLYEALAVPPAQRRVGRGIALFVLATGVGIAAHYQALPVWPGMAQAFAPLYLIFYPLGFLPETVAQFASRPWVGWLAAAAVLVLLGLMYRKVRRTNLLFAFLAMLVVRLVPTGQPFEWIHMIGGGQLLLANALFATGAMVVVFRIMDNPKWRVPMISITTMIVIIFFAMQWRSLRFWHDAGNYVRDFQQTAAKAVAAGEPVGILPDYQFHHGAPLCLSDSIAYDTPFSKRLAAVPLLKINPEAAADRKRVWVRSWSAQGGEVEITVSDKAPLYRLFPNAGAFLEGSPISLRALWGESMPEGTVVVTTNPGKVHVILNGTGLPTRLVPGNLAGKESDRESKPDTNHQ